jgi:hypothetical protein
MCANVAYMGAYYQNDHIIPATEPFLLKADGSLSICSAKKEKKITMILERKFPRFKRVEDFAWGLRRTNAEGANKVDFSDVKKFFSIYDIPFQIVETQIKDNKKYRFVRFKSSTNRNANFAEVEFFGKRSEQEPEKKLTGKIIGFPFFSTKDEHPYVHAMDGNLETWFEKSKRTEGWVGLDLGKGHERIITKVRYCPRSDTNFIIPGDTFELFYWNKSKWNSFGKKIAKGCLLTYTKVPSGTIYLLRNLSRGAEERIFTYEKGKQVFW